LLALRRINAGQTYHHSRFIGSFDDKRIAVTDSQNTHIEKVLNSSGRHAEKKRTAAGGKQGYAHDRLLQGLRRYERLGLPATFGHVD
jgi:hypothetical protein